MKPLTFETIEMCLDRIASAWNCGDACAFAQEFTDSATYVLDLGECLTGKSEIESEYVPILARRPKNKRMVINLVSVKFLCNEVASVLTISGAALPKKISYSSMQTLTMLRKGGCWRCVACHSTKMSRRMKSAYNRREASGLPERRTLGLEGLEAKHNEQLAVFFKTFIHT